MTPTAPLSVLATLLGVLAACGGRTSGADAPCAGVEDQAVETITEAQIEKAPESRSDLVLDVSSNLEKPARLTVHLEGKLALDVRLPGTPASCSHPPVYSYAYDLPDREVTVTAITDYGERSTASLDLSDQREWAVVQLQEGFPLQIEPWDSQPQWG